MRFSNWSTYSQSAELLVNEDVRLNVACSSEHPVVLSKTTTDGEIVQIDVFPAGTQTQRYQLRDVAGLRMTTKKGAEFAMAYDARPLQRGEPTNDDAPPERAPHPNVLVQLRERFRRDMAVQREGFDGLPGHMLDDDDPGMFEEEQDALVKRQEQWAEEDADKAAEAASDDPGGNPPEEPNPPSEGGT